MSKKKNHDHNGSTGAAAEKQRTEFDYCKVCRLNHNLGRRHNYFPNHKKALSSLLSRFQAKVKNEVVAHLKNPSLLDSGNWNGNRLWCVFCECDVIECSSSFTCGNAIEHFASVEHLKRVKSFLWKYGGGMDRLDSFRISESDFAKWAKKCKVLKTGAGGEGSCGSLVGPSNDIQTQMKYDYVERHDDNNDLCTPNFDNILPHDVVPLQNHTNQRSQVLPSDMSRVTVDGPQVHHTYMGTDVGVHRYASTGFSGSFGNQHFQFPPKEHQPYSLPVNGHMYSHERIASITTYPQDTSTGLLSLSQVSASAKPDSGGNVHTGAPPPWFSAMESVQIGSTSNPRLSCCRVELVKTSKLNPKRVGAAWAEKRKIELELGKRGEFVNRISDANWLPNFGRVWQSGSRKESRKEFMGEIKTSSKVDTELKPYISKRMVSLPSASRKESEKEIIGEEETSCLADNSSRLQPYVSKRMVSLPSASKKESEKDIMGEETSCQVDDSSQLQPYVSKRLRSH